METYKQFKLRILHGLYKRYMDSDLWVDTDLYTDYVAKYKVVDEAIKSMKDEEPHIWIKCAINDFFESWTYEMLQILEKGGLVI